MGSNNFDDQGVMELTRNIMIMSIVALFIIVIFVIFVCFFSKQRRQAIEAANNNNCVCEQKGLDESLLKTIQIIQFDPKRFEEGLECAVCLSELKEGEKARILPKCDHVFHMECIDMWFLSHTTCPICRNPIVDQSETTDEEQNSSVLVVGDEDSSNHECLDSEQASSSSSSYKNEGRPDLVIDIPERGEGKDEEDEKRPVSCSGMRSLTRILSGSRRFSGISPRSSTVNS